MKHHIGRSAYNSSCCLRISAKSCFLWLWCRLSYDLKKTIIKLTFHSIVTVASWLHHRLNDCFILIIINSQNKRGLVPVRSLRSKNLASFVMIQINTGIFNYKN